jgi:hypothetical protein
MPQTTSSVAVTVTNNHTVLMQGRPVLLTGNADFTNGDADGHVFDFQSASPVILNVYPGLNWSKGIVVQLPTSAASLTINPGQGVTLNGATTPIVKTLSATLRVITITPRSASDSYEVTVGS